MCLGHKQLTFRLSLAQVFYIVKSVSESLLAVQGSLVMRSSGKLRTGSEAGPDVESKAS
jgi:hypothetical protein